MKHHIGTLICLLFVVFGLSAQQNELNQSQVDSILLNSSGTCAFFTILSTTTAPTCNDFIDGVVCVDEPLDGVGPYLYQWVGGPATQCWNGLGAGTYTVIIVDQGQGQSCSEDVILNEPGDLTVFSMNALPPSCFGTCDAQANPIVIGGNGGNMFDWSSGEMTPAATMLCDPFTLTITDMNGCVFDTTFVFNDAPEEIEIDEVIQDIDCNGNDNGSIEITINGGTPPYMTNWTGPGGFTSMDEDIFNLEPGTYTVSILDDNMCTHMESFQIMEPDPLVLNFDKVDNDCFGDALGQIDLTVTGGTGPYNYVWTGPNGFTSGNEDLVDLECGTYDLVLTDDNLCTAVLSVDILCPIELVIDEIVSDISCFGENDGAIDITVSGGTPDYSYSWTGPGGFLSIDEDISSLGPGDYTVTVTDDNDCVVGETFTIIEPDELILSAIPTGVSCVGDMDGSIDLTIMGGTMPFDISWTGPNGFSSMDEDIFGLEVGSYTVVVTDDNLCAESITVQISEPDPITVDETITQASCGGLANGTIEIEVMGGTIPYDFSWTGPNGFTSMDEDIFNLEVGFYDLLVTDGNMCTFMATYEVTEIDGFTLDFDLTPVNCFGQNTGAIDMTITNALDPITINWTGPNGFTSMDEDISMLFAGTYTVNVIDANLCEETVDIDVLENDSIEFDFDITQPACFGEANGAIDVTVTGGVMNYTYLWTGPGGFMSNDEDINGLAAGTYFLTLTDALMCIQVGSAEIIDPDQIVIDGIVSDLECNADFSGAIDLTILNAVDPYDVMWTGPNGFNSTDEDITGLEAGTYFVNVIDANNCTQLAVFDVLEPDVISVDEVITNITCFGPMSGAISIEITGGTEPYTVTWTGPNGFTSMDEDIFMLEAGFYDLSILDDNNCLFTATYEITALPDLTISADVADILCNGDDNGSIDLTINGGTMPYTITWTGPNGFMSMDEDISNLEPGIYDVTVTDFIGCDEMGTFEIMEPALLELTFDIVNPTCPFDDGSIEVIPSGGTLPYDIEWFEFMGPSISTNALIDNLGPGIYVVVVEDGNNCMNGDTISINHPTPTVTETITPVTCPGGNDGSIELDIMTADPPVDITWTGPNGFTSMDEDIFNLEEGMYTVDIIDQALCNITLLLEVPVLDPIEIVADISQIACAGDANGAIDITINNAVDPYSVSWTGPNGFTSIDEDISNLEPGSYTITVNDANMCMADSTIEILDGIGLDFSFDIQDALCKNASDGSIDLTINNGMAPFIINWTGPDGFSSMDEDIFMLEAGTYSLNVQDANLCVSDTMVFLNEPDSILLEIVTSPPLCSYSDEGSIALTNLGGTPNFAFDWTGPNGFTSMDQDLFNLFPGEYMLTVTDLNLCVEDTLISILAPDTIQVDFTVMNSTCGNMDGSVTATASGGTVVADYTYQWFDAAMTGIGNTNSINGFGAGVYTLVTMDDNMCSDTSMVTISDDVYTVDALIMDSDCGGANNGSIELTITGATAPINIIWSGPNGFASNLEDIFNLEPGDYEVSITDNNNCLFNEIYSVDEPEDIVVDAVLANPPCFGINDGSITIDITGGDGNYSILWTGPNGFLSMDEDITGLEGGTYNLFISDLSGCDFSMDYDLSIPTEIEATPVFQGPVCPGIPDGFIDLTVSGGQPNYTFSWTGPNGFVSIDEDISNLEAGDYTVIITDAFLCEREYTYTLANATEILVDAMQENVSCFGEDNASIDLSASGGMDPYDFDWVGPNMFTSADEDITNLEPGMYTVTVNDQLNCETVLEFEITEPDTLDVTIDLNNPSCWYLENGALDITVIGGTPPYTYSWTGPNGFASIDEDISNLAEGTYSLTVTDSLMCTYSDDYTLISPTEITVDLDNIVSPTCDDSPDGQIFITANGGVGTLTYQWTGPMGYTSMDEDPSMLTGGTFNVQITDDFSCVLDTSFIVVAQNLLLADAGVYGELCDQDTLILDGSNSVGATSYEWLVDGTSISVDVITELVLDLSISEVILNVSNDLCSDSDTLTLSINQLPEVDAGPNIEGFVDEEFVLGGSPTTSLDNQVLWIPDLNLNDNTLFNPTITVQEDQIYIVTATDAFGCQSSDSVFVDLISPVNVTNTITPNGDGYNETWIIDGVINFPNIEVQIYNRWGELLFQSDGYSVPWDGNYEGKPLPSGTYYYIIELNDPMFPDHLDGPITILR
ncbi:MAG: gliding motility-associated C-terminal domain-containing protein [Bacteroidota bacterium]